MSGGTPATACGHAVHFYDQAYPADAASDFIAAGLRAGDACVVVLTAPNRRAVAQRLRAQGLRTDAAHSHRGSYRAIDTHDALAAMQVGGRLDLSKARVLLASVLGPPVDGSTRRARLVGDPAPPCSRPGSPKTQSSSKPSSTGWPQPMAPKSSVPTRSPTSAAPAACSRCSRFAPSTTRWRFPSGSGRSA